MWLDPPILAISAENLIFPRLWTIVLTMNGQEGCEATDAILNEVEEIERKTLERVREEVEGKLSREGQKIDKKILHEGLELGRKILEENKGQKPQARAKQSSANHIRYPVFPQIGTADKHRQIADNQ